MKPRIFLSAVTSEFRTLRLLIAQVLTRLGYDPVWQDIFGTESGDLRQVLEKQIDSCDGLLHLVGHGYGTEPPEIDEDIGRVSYTQFEYLYATRKHKKTWVVFVEPGCTHDVSVAELDLPANNVHPDPALYQTERKILQEAWRHRLQADGHLWHQVHSDTEVELKIERLKDDFAELRRKFEQWQHDIKVTQFGVERNAIRTFRALAVVMGLVLLLCLGIWWVIFRQPDEVSNAIKASVRADAQLLTGNLLARLSALNTDNIRGQLNHTIEETYQRQLQQAEQLSEWKLREAARQDAAGKRAQQLARVDEFLASVTATVGSSDASQEFLELTRIIQTEGVDQALSYIAGVEDRLLTESEHLTKQKRQKLLPLLEGIRLHRTKNELELALALSQRVLKVDNQWPELLLEHYATLVDMGDHAKQYESVSNALTRFDAAQKAALQLIALDRLNPKARRALAVSYERQGEALSDLGHIQDALAKHEDSMRIFRELVDADSSDADTKDCLGTSHLHLGDLYLKLGRTSDAFSEFKANFAIREELADADPMSAELRRSLIISRQRLGTVYLVLGRTADASIEFDVALRGCAALAAADSASAEKQLDLSHAHRLLGEVLLSVGDIKEALTHFDRALGICRAVAIADPTNTDKQLALSNGFNQLGDVYLKLGRLDDALRQFEDDFKISNKLAEADPTSANKQRCLSVSYEQLGNVLQSLDRLDDAQDKFEASLKIRSTLASADISDQQKQNDLQIAYVRIGDLLRRRGQYEKALLQYDEATRIALAQANADAGNAERQRDLYTSFQRQGDMYMKLGRTEDARTKYTQFFDRCLEQANADPLGAQKQRDLMLANAKLGEVELMLDNFSSARSFFQSGIAILDAMIEKQMLVDSSKQEKAMLEERIHFCDLTSKAVGNWEDVQKSDSSSLPALLAVRIAWFSRRGNVTEVAQAGAKLRDFEPKTKDNLYNAACAYSLCAGFLLKDTKQLNEDEQAMFHNFTQLSLACLREAIGAGFNDYQHIRQDTDLAAIQKLPEFEKLLIEGKSR